MLENKLDGNFTGGRGWAKRPPVQLFEAPRVQGKFKLAEGSVSNADRVAVMQSDAAGQRAGGYAKFAELTGEYAGGEKRASFKQLTLQGGVLRGSGGVDIAGNSAPRATSRSRSARRSRRIGAFTHRQRGAAQHPPRLRPSSPAPAPPAFPAARYRARIAVASVAILLSAGMVLFIGQCLKTVIDQGFGKGEPRLLDQTLGALAVLIGVVWLYDAPQRLLDRRALHGRPPPARRPPPAHALPRLLRGRGTGEVSSRVTNDVTLIEAM